MSQKYARSGFASTGAAKPTDGEVAFCSAQPKREVFLADHLQCCLCGSELIFHRTVDFAELAVQESSECPSCRIRSRARSYGLH